MSTTNYKELTTADLAKRLNDFRRTMLATFNQDALSMLEEVERRLNGGAQMSVTDHLSKKEKELREAYERDKSRALDKSRYNIFYGVPVEPYEEWKVKHLKIEREIASGGRAFTKRKNEFFQSRLKMYLEKHGKMPKDEDFSLEISYVASNKAGNDISILANNKISLGLLKDVLRISNLKDPTKLDRIKYWHVTRDEYERKKKVKTKKK